MPLPAYHGRTHGVDGTDPIPFPGVTSLADTIIPLVGTGAFWKLNESTGLVATDSGPNGYDLTSTSVRTPAWAQAAGPPGEQSAGFNDTPNNVKLARTGITQLGASDMTVLIWAYRGDNSENTIIGSGDPETTLRGWQMNIEAFNRNTFNKALFTVGNTGGNGAIEGTSVLTVGSWYFLCATHTSGTWRLYVNGVAEGTPITTVMTSPAVPEYWIGSPTDVAPFYFFGRGSYGAVLSTALTAAEIASLNDLAGLSGQVAEGMVLTNPGSGGDPYWAYPVTTWIDGV